MLAKKERRIGRATRRGTVRRVAENKRALILTDAGILAIIEQLGGIPLVAGDYLSGLASERGSCLLRNETTRQDIAVVIDAFAVPPSMVPKSLMTE